MEVPPVASDAGCCREPPTVPLVETLRLPPPPCWSRRAPGAMLHGIYVPLPPCTFQPPERSSPCNSTRLRKKDDPFFAAYLECSKRLSWEQGKASNERKRKQLGKIKGGIGRSCKYDCGIGRSCKYDCDSSEASCASCASCVGEVPGEEFEAQRLPCLKTCRLD